MNKNEFIRLWAQKSNLSIKDAKEIWGVFESIISDCVESREELHLKNFGHLLYSTHRVPSSHTDITTGEVIPSQHEEVGTVYFRLSRNLKDLMIDDPTKRRLYQTRQAELRRAEKLDEGVEDLENLEDYEEGGEDTEDDE